MKNSERTLMAQAVPDVVRRRRFVLGWSAIAVDKLNRRCNLDGFYDTAGNDLDALGLTDVDRDNRLTAEISQAGVSSLIHAVSWLVTTRATPSRRARRAHQRAGRRHRHRHLGRAAPRGALVPVDHRLRRGWRADRA
jgi:hypothetical protein